MLELWQRGPVYTACWYVDSAGRCHGRDHYDSLEAADQAKFAAPVKYVTHQPQYRKKDKFRHEDAGIYAIKIFKHRLMCFTDGQLLIITHGFTKKDDSLPPGELNRAKRLRQQYLTRKGWQ